MYLKLVSLCMFILLACTAQAMTNEKLSSQVREYKAMALNAPARDAARKAIISA